MIYLRSTVQILLIAFIFSSCQGQSVDINIKKEDISRTLNILASDDMRGRNALSKPDIEKAGAFIETEFKKANLAFLDKATSYKQPFEYKRDELSHELNNIVGILPGKSKSDEFVIFSAHYDHIGIIPTLSNDSIANGADDNASGVSGIIELAKYFSRKNDNERTLIFVAFTAEEIGGYGSQYFAKQFNPAKIIAMFNLEMIGKHSKFGKNNAFLTGYQYSDFGKILKKNLKDSEFKFYPDPYPNENLFYRSDNASLAQLGVPAHTISSAQIDKDKLYHTVDDEVESLDVENIASIIKAIAMSSKTIVSGQDTPTRITI
ncbi:MAG: M20/M25/M40 family metallo-hydrolase, partial [Sphingobacteriales bacterium]